MAMIAAVVTLLANNGQLTAELKFPALRMIGNTNSAK